jgi:hypothetical protein
MYFGFSFDPVSKGESEGEVRKYLLCSSLDETPAAFAVRRDSFFQSVY